MIVYLAKNVVNNKCYVGITIRSLTYRRNIHKQTWKLNRNPNSKLYKAFDKYGFESFDWTVIDTAKTKEELNAKEKYWILFLNTKRAGYNSTDGGDYNPNIDRVGENNPKSKKYLITYPDGTKEIVHGLSEWCRTHGLHKQGLIPVAQGKHKQYKGYTASYIE